MTRALCLAIILHASGFIEMDSQSYSSFERFMMLQQNVKAKKVRGKTLTFSGYLKTDKAFSAF
jgi:hypothetical protein